MCFTALPSHEPLSNWPVIIINQNTYQKTRHTKPILSIERIVTRAKSYLEGRPKDNGEILAVKSEALMFEINTRTRKIGIGLV